MDRPSAPASLWYGLAGGLCGGSSVGAAEALYILSASRPAEYQALVYGVVLYGGIGAGAGLGVGVLLAVVGRGVRMSAAVQWCLGGSVVASGLGFLTLRFVLNKIWYMEQGVPTSTQLWIVCACAIAVAVGTWFGGSLLTKTPLRVLPGPKGTFAIWSVGLGIALLLAMAPAPGATGATGGAMGARPNDASLLDKPNVVLLLLDTTRADALGVYGAGPDATPNLDAFARDAVVFDQHIVSAPWTRPSVASLLTSLAPASHGCDTKVAGLSDAVVTIAERLRDGGYATGGLPNNAHITAAHGFDQGFDWYPYTPEYPLTASESSHALALYGLARHIYARLVPRQRVESYYAPAEIQLARASEFIAKNLENRFFLFVHLMEPHDPYFAHPVTGEAVARAALPSPDPTRTAEIRTLYAGEVRHLDAEIGRFFDWLRAEGLYDRSLVIVTADHGEEFQEHGGWWHGTTLYDEQLRVPLLVKLPENVRGGTRVVWQVGQIDVAPTIAELVGLTPDASWQGRMLFDDYFDADLAVSASSWATHPASRDVASELEFEGYQLRSLRSAGQKLIQTTRVPAGDVRRDPPEACYDLREDPGECAGPKESGATCDGALAARLHTLMEDRRAKRVVTGSSPVGAAEQGAAERAGLEALGYAPIDRGEGEWYSPREP